MDIDSISYRLMKIDRKTPPPTVTTTVVASDGKICVIGGMIRGGTR